MWLYSVGEFGCCGNLACMSVISGIASHRLHLLLTEENGCLISRLAAEIHV